MSPEAEFYSSKHYYSRSRFVIGARVRCNSANDTNNSNERVKGSTVGGRTRRHKSTERSV